MRSTNSARPEVVEAVRSAAHKLQARYTPGAPDACWPWQASTWKKGYGRFYVNSRLVLPAHRAQMMLLVGAIPADIEVCHTCDNPVCVNPKHLFLGTTKDNAADKVAKGRAASAPGEKNHFAKLSPENVIFIRSKQRSSREFGDLSRQFGVSEGAIRFAYSGETWRHLPSSLQPPKEG